MEDRPLPEDVVSTVLRRLPPRDLAVSRGVCKAWRAVVDGERLLRPDLLPLALGGIFISLLQEPAPPVFFSPPSMGPSKVAGKLQSFVKMDGWWDLPTIVGSCNGLLFLDDKVANPATRQWAPVPPCPVGREVYNNRGEVYFVFDPLVSPHYQVLFVHDPYDLEDESEWPPSTCTIWIYSSGTGSWEEKPFVREGGPAGTVAEERSARAFEDLHSVYWRGALYVHCNCDYIMRITLSDYKYHVIKLPAGFSAREYPNLHLVKSKNGVYVAFVGDQCQLRVWFLNESNEWVLKYDINLQAVPAHFSRDQDYPVDKPWILHYGNYNNREAATDGISDWDSDNDNVIRIQGGTEEKCNLSQFICIFGFHPYKEVAFLCLPNNERVLACHLDSLKIQDLGQLHLPYRFEAIDKTFVYTPCWTGQLSQND